MPGAIPNAQFDPYGAWAQFHPNQQKSIYDDALAKGYSYLGGDNWDYGGAPGAGAPMGSGVSKPAGVSSGDTTSLATGGTVGGPGQYSATAQLADVNSQFADIKKRGMSDLNEAAALSGGFSGGIPFENRQKFISDTDRSQQAAIERIMNDILGRNQNADLQKQQFE